MIVDTASIELIHKLCVCQLLNLFLIEQFSFCNLVCVVFTDVAMSVLHSCWVEIEFDEELAFAHPSNFLGVSERTLITEYFNFNW